MEAFLLRRWFTAESTIGELFRAFPMDEGDRNFLAYVLEDRYRGDDLSGDKLVPGRTCIPCGRYKVTYTWSPRFNKYLLLLNDVPHFTGIRVHGGNKPEDTEGCLLTGTKRAPNSVLYSQEALSIVEQVVRLAMGRGEEVWLTVALAPGAQPV